MKFSNHSTLQFNAVDVRLAMNSEHEKRIQYNPTLSSFSLLSVFAEYNLLICEMNFSSTLTTKR
jgi:hypothetical protein